MVYSRFTTLLTCRILQKKQIDIERQLESYQILEIGTGVQMVTPSSSQIPFLSTLELVVITIGCLIFVVALFTAICITCSRKHRR